MQRVSAPVRRYAAWLPGSKGERGSTDEWSNSWWELRSPGNVRISQARLDRFSRVFFVFARYELRLFASRLSKSSANVQERSKLFALSSPTGHRQLPHDFDGVDVHRQRRAQERRALGDSLPSSCKEASVFPNILVLLLNQIIRAAEQSHQFGNGQAATRQLKYSPPCRNRIKISATQRFPVFRGTLGRFISLPPPLQYSHLLRLTPPAPTLFTPNAAKRRPGAALRRDLLALEPLAQELACASHPTRSRPRRSSGGAGDNGCGTSHHRAASTVRTGEVSRSGGLPAEHTHTQREREGRLMGSMFLGLSLSLTPHALARAQVHASFSHSLLRVVPYDDCPSLSSAEDHLSLVASSAATAAGGGWSASSLSSASALGFSSSSSSSSSPPPYALAAAASPAAYLAGFGGVAVDAGVIRGGDVVRLCHLTSTGFLTCEALGSETTLGREARLAAREAAAMGRVQQREGRGPKEPAVAEREARGEGGSDGGSGGGGPFLYISATPRRRQKLQNASSRCLWVLERTHCALGGRPLRGSFSSAAAAIEPQQGVGGAPAYSIASASSRGGKNAGRGVQQSSSSPRSHFYAAGSPLPASPYASGGGGGGGSSSVPERRRRRHSDADLVSGSETGALGGGVGGGASGARPSSFFTGGGDRDPYAETVAEGRRRQGAGDAVEHVRIKHLATMRYLCVGEQCDGGAEVGTRRRGDSRKEGGAAMKAAATTRVGMLTVDRHAAVPPATVFVIRPRTAGAGTGAATAAATARWLGPDDLVHLEHKDTGLFLSALPIDQEVAGGSVGLTMVKSPLTTEASWGRYLVWQSFLV